MNRETLHYIQTQSFLTTTDCHFLSAFFILLTSPLVLKPTWAAEWRQKWELQLSDKIRNFFVKLQYVNLFFYLFTYAARDTI
jgi:hypothetical protein